MQRQAEEDGESRDTAARTPEPGSVDEQVAANLREFREKLGWSQDDLAEKMTAAGEKYWRQTVHRNETGQRKISVGELAALAHVLGVSVSRLMQPAIEHNTVAWFDRFTASANAAFEDIAAATGQLLFARAHLEEGIEDARKRGLDERERVRAAIADARAVLEHGTPERAVQTGREDYARGYEVPDES